MVEKGKHKYHINSLISDVHAFMDKLFGYWAETDSACGVEIISVIDKRKKRRNILQHETVCLMYFRQIFVFQMERKSLENIAMSRTNPIFIVV